MNSERSCIAQARIEPLDSFPCPVSNCDGRPFAFLQYDNVHGPPDARPVQGVSVIVNVRNLLAAEFDNYIAAFQAALSAGLPPLTSFSAACGSAGGRQRDFNAARTPATLRPSPVRTGPGRR